MIFYADLKMGHVGIVKIPLLLTPNLAFLAGCIIGDGHLGKNKFRISIELTSHKILSMILEKFNRIFKLKLKIFEVKRRSGKSKSWRIKFQCKAIWLLFNNVFEIPSGKKSNIVKVPKVISSSNEKTIKSFITGLFLTDGGHKKNRILFSSTSELLLIGVKEVLSKFNINCSINKIFDKKLDRTFFELLINTSNTKMFISAFPESKIKSNIAGVA